MGINGIQIDQDMKLQRKVWKFQRIGIICLVLFLVIAALGGFGSGPLSHAKGGGIEHGARIAYNRIMRYQSPDKLSFERVVVDRRPAQQKNAAVKTTELGEEMRIWIERDYLDNVRIERIEPQPVSTEIDEDRLIYRFAARRKLNSAGQFEPVPGKVVFHLQANKPGRLQGKAGINEGKPIEFTQLVMP